MRSTFRYTRLALLLTMLTAASTLHAADKLKPFKLKTTDGNTRTLQDFPGKAVIVSFFFPTCAYCNAEFPELKKIVDKYKDQGLSIVLINVVPGENKLIVPWQEKHQYDFPVLTGASQASLQRDYKLKATPTHYLVDAEGNIFYTRSGYKEGDDVEMEKQVRAALHLP